MAKTLIIVESPAKTKTLKNFLGSDFMVEASVGHVRDLPEHRMGVDIENDFEPTYRVVTDRKEVVAKLKKAAAAADTIYLASDPDREGEAIAWHLAEALKLKQPKRIQFNEITKQAVLESLERPRDVDMDRVNAQQARRVLDRLIGYMISPLLSRRVQRGLSAGRVQSVALRLICEREREIQAFIPTEYWSLTAHLSPTKPEKEFRFLSRLTHRAGEKIVPGNQAEMDTVLLELDGALYRVAEVKKREQKRNAYAPFITSTLQQEAARKLGFTSRKTMQIAQQLYEGLELGASGSIGLITYMRTDSVRVAAEAQAEARGYIVEEMGANYVPATPNQFKTRSEAQDAHEAIRPTSVLREPEAVRQYLDQDQLNLYRLIWQRFLASQMSPAIFDVTTVDIAAAQPAPDAIPYTFRSTGSVERFDGFLRVYVEGKDVEESEEDQTAPLPPLTVGQPLDLLKLEPKQHFTEPPPRYSEATIVKALEEKGIGRPSTYASIISVLRDREYVELISRRFHPTVLGFTVNDKLVKHFQDYVNVQFTADMESKLDEVEEGHQEWKALLRTFYAPFDDAVKTAWKEMEDSREQPEETEFRCPATDRVMLRRKGRFGPFVSCSGYPECKKILKMNADGTPVEGLNFRCGLEPAEEAPPKEAFVLPDGSKYECPDGHGVMVQRMSARGPFLGCSAYPKCRSTLKLSPEGLVVEGQSFTCTLGKPAAKRGAKAKASTKSTASSTTKRTTKTTTKSTSAAAPRTSRKKASSEE